MKIRTKKCISILLVFVMLFEVFVCQPVLFAASNANDDAIEDGKQQLTDIQSSGDFKEAEEAAQKKASAKKEMDNAKKEMAGAENDLNGTETGNSGSTGSLSKLADFAAKAQQVILKIGEIITKIGEILKKVGKALKIIGKVLQAAACTPFTAWLAPIGKALVKAGELIYKIGNVMYKVGKCITAVGELTKGKDANFGKIISGIKEAVSTGWTEGQTEYDAIDTSSYEQKATEIVTKGQEAWGKVSDFFGGQSGQDDGM